MAIDIHVSQLKEKIEKYNSNFAIETEKNYAENFINEIKKTIYSLEIVLESINTEYRIKKLLEEIE